MNDKEWEINMGKLRAGELQLAEHEENLLSQRARKDFYELKEYVSALESGYRAQGKCCGSTGPRPAGATVWGD